MKQRPVDANSLHGKFLREYELNRRLNKKDIAGAWQGAMQLLYDAPTIEPAKQEWIDVHDRLPDKDTLVLCVGAKGGMFLGFVRYLYGDDKTAYVRVPNARSGRYAAFWMPLPEPPKEGE